MASATFSVKPGLSCLSRRNPLRGLSWRLDAGETQALLDMLERSGWLRGVTAKAAACTREAEDLRLANRRAAGVRFRILVVSSEDRFEELS